MATGLHPFTRIQARHRATAQEAAAAMLDELRARGPMSETKLVKAVRARDWLLTEATVVAALGLLRRSPGVTARKAKPRGRILSA